MREHVLQILLCYSNRDQVARMQDSNDSRRVATRSDKLAANYLAFVQLA
jgi:hypothetical protein